MTVAVCIKCGDRKIGALVGCTSCKFIPVSLDDKAASMLLSDHHMASTSLLDAAKQIQNGGFPELPAEMVKQYKLEFQKPASIKTKVTLLGCLVLVVSPWLIYIGIELIRKISR